MIAQQESAAVGAGFGERLVAYIIDAIILLVPTIILAVLLQNQALQSIVGVIIGAGYVVYFWTSSGSTPGKSLMGLKVVSAETGDVIDIGTAIMRYVGYIVSSIPLGLGFLWILWDDKNEGWHDKIAKTRVVRSK